MRFATICVLAASLALGACNPKKGSNATARESVRKTGSGSYDFEMVQYVVNPGSTVNPPELGVLIKEEQGTFTLHDGTTETGWLQLYDFKGPKGLDGLPDSALMTKANGDIVSIGLDRGSECYDPLLKKLGSRISVFNPTP